MADFSNLVELSAIWPQTIAWYVRRKNKPTDEMLLEAFERTDPPLLPERDARVVRAVLSHKRGRRAKDAPSIAWLADRIEMSNRTDLPREFLEQLAERLRTGKRHTHTYVAMDLVWEREKRERESFVWFIYDDIYQLLVGGDFVEHPIFGRLDVPKHERTRSNRALAMTQFVLDKWMRRYPPSLRTMQNIITKRNRRVFRESPRA